MYRILNTVKRYPKKTAALTTIAGTVVAMVATTPSDDSFTDHLYSLRERSNYKYKETIPLIDNYILFKIAYIENNDFAAEVCKSKYTSFTGYFGKWNRYNNNSLLKL